ncbi:MAG: hypothetical protein AAGD38_07190 [Acidobacteriota bacterium]
MIRIAGQAIAILSWAWLVAPVAAAELSGTLVFSGKASDALDRRAGIVYWVPDTAVDIAVPEEPIVVTTVRKEFLPRVVGVPVGGTVRFPNQDPILHNVFSVSGGNRFDLGLYGQGDGRDVTFEKPGLVRVFCNVHQEMVAYVLVLETPYFVAPGRDGGFRFDDLPAGSGKLVVWHERAKVRELPLTLPTSGPVKMALELTKPRVPDHLNKFGKPYKRRRGRRY